MACIRHGSGLSKNFKELRGQYDHFGVKQLVQDGYIIPHRQVNENGALFTVLAEVMVTIFAGYFGQILVVVVTKVAFGQPEGGVPMPV
jgi:hypothetical protein